jgi:hypothetical protein
MSNRTLPNPLRLADALFAEVELECGCGGNYSQEPHERWTREGPVACSDCGAELSGNEFWAMAEITSLKADVRYWKGLACHQAAPDLLEALKDLVYRCDGDEGVRADGSNIDTAWAHTIIAKAEGGHA